MYIINGRAPSIYISRSIYNSHFVLVFSFFRLRLLSISLIALKILGNESGRRDQSYTLRLILHSSWLPSDGISSFYFYVCSKGKIDLLPVVLLLLLRSCRSYQHWAAINTFPPTCSPRYAPGSLDRSSFLFFKYIFFARQRIWDRYTYTPLW